MKKFIVSVLCVAVFFLGLGSLAENVGAKFKSDARALELIAKARQAIGGDEAIRLVKSLSIKGNTTITFDFNGTPKTEQGETELALQLPNQLMKTIKIGKGNADGNAQIVEESAVVMMSRNDGSQPLLIKETNSQEKNVTVKVEEATAQGGGKVIVKKQDGTVQEVNLEGTPQEFVTKDGTKIFVKKVGEGDAVFNTKDGKKMTISHDMKIEKASGHHNELARLMLALLLSSPEGGEFSYTFAGEESVAGIACNAINAEFGGETFKLFLDQSSNLPVAMNYRGTKMPKMIKIEKGAKSDAKPIEVRMPAPETANFQVRFSDFRGVSGVQFPHRWETSLNGQNQEVLEISSLEVNPANIADKFKSQPIKVLKMVKAQ